MGTVSADRPVPSLIAAPLGAALAGTILLSPAATIVAHAQTEPDTAANGVVLPSPYYDPAAARIADLAESAAVTNSAMAPAPPADESAATDAPEAVSEAPDAVAEAPETGNSVTTVLGGSDVAVSSVGGSHEVDRPSKRSGHKK